ncbi:MAG: hypothetical protein ACP6IS_11215 [Candidatus Asgardarchaeia archaeon]
MKKGRKTKLFKKIKDKFSVRRLNKLSNTIRIETDDQGISRLADIIQVFSFGVLVWIGLILLGVADVVFYFTALSATIIGLSTWFIKDLEKYEKTLKKVAIALSISTGLIGLGIYGLWRVIEL